MIGDHFLRGFQKSSKWKCRGFQGRVDVKTGEQLVGGHRSKTVKFQTNSTKTKVLMVDTCFGPVPELTLGGILGWHLLGPLYSHIYAVVELLVVVVVCLGSKMVRSLSRNGF